jgi:hypothetical protein
MALLSIHDFNLNGNYIPSLGQRLAQILLFLTYCYRTFIL